MSGRGHVLTVEPDADYAARFLDAPTEYRWSITCLAPEKCGGWEECGETHEVDGVSAAEGPWECDESAPWSEEEEYDFHGVTHTWLSWHSWTVPFDGCVVAANAGDLPDDLPLPLRPGRWLVEDDWDDTWMTLSVVRELDPTEEPAHA